MPGRDARSSRTETRPGIWRRGWAGTIPAKKQGMAAVFALIMLPIIASIGFFIGVVRFDGSLAAMFAGATFIALATGVLVGALRIAREAEGPGH